MSVVVVMTMMAVVVTMMTVVVTMMTVVMALVAMMRVVTITGCGCARREHSER
jgi:hypothetical protein